MRVPVHVVRGQTDLAEHDGHPVGQLRASRDVVRDQRVADDLPERHPRVQRRERVLEDQPDLPLVRPQPGSGQLRQVDDVPVRGAVTDLTGRRRLGPDDGPAQRRLAAPGLPHQSERLAGTDRQVHPVDGVYLPHSPAEEALLHREVHPEVPHVEHRREVILAARPVAIRNRADGIARRAGSFVRCINGFPDRFPGQVSNDRQKFTAAGDQARLIQHALDMVSRCRRDSGGVGGVTQPVDRLVAARMVTTARRPACAVRNLSPHRHQPLARTGAHPRDRAEQRSGVWMFRVGEDLVDARMFHHTAQVHDGDLIGDLRHHTQVMGDEQHRHPGLALQLGEQVQDASLNGHIQSRGRFVGDQQRGPT